MDAIVGVSWAAISQSSVASGQLLREVAAGVPFVVPGLWMYEVSNALLVLMRRKKIEPGQCTRAREALGNLNPIIDDEGPRRALNRSWRTSIRSPSMMRFTSNWRNGENSRWRRGMKR